MFLFLLTLEQQHAFSMNNGDSCSRRIYALATYCSVKNIHLPLLPPYNVLTSIEQTFKEQIDSLDKPNHVLLPWTAMVYSCTERG